MPAKRPIPEHLLLRNGRPTPRHGLGNSAWIVFLVAAFVVLSAWYLGFGKGEEEGYSGTVISVGEEKDFFDTRTRPRVSHYIIVEEASGVQKKHYISESETQNASPGWYVTKAPGVNSRLQCPEQEQLRRKFKPYLEDQKR